MTGDKPPAPLADPIFLGRELDRLSDLIETQCQAIFRIHGITIPVKSCSLVLVLAQLGTGTAADLSKHMDVSHQLVLQKMPKLVKLGLVTSAQDRDDARKKAFSLTAEGHHQLDQFQRCRALILSAYTELFAEVGNLFDVISAASAALRHRPLDQRLPLPSGGYETTPNP